MTHSNIEFASLELQRFWTISKNDRHKLRAKFGWRRCHRRPRAPQPTCLAARPRRPPAPRQHSPVPSTPAGPSRLMLIGASTRCPDAQLWLSTSNFARNSSMSHSNIEFASLELQRFWTISKNDRHKLRAKFGWRRCHRRPRAPQPACPSARPSGLSGTAARPCI